MQSALSEFCPPNNTLKHQGKRDRKFERLCGGAKTDLLAGLQELLNNVSSDHRDPADASLLDSLGKLVQRAKRQKGFDLLAGLQRLVSNEAASRQQSVRSVHVSSARKKQPDEGSFIGRVALKGGGVTACCLETSFIRLEK